MRTLLRLNFFKSAYDQYFRFVLIIAVLLLIINPTFSIGWIIGNGLFFLNLIFKNLYYDFILTMKDFHLGLFILYYLGSLIVMLLAVALGFIWPQVISPYASVAGYLGFKFFLYFKQLTGGESLEYPS